MRRAAPAAILAAPLAAPATASAHGVVQRADLPIPEWLFAWAAAIVLVASFAGLAALWPTPRLQQPPWRGLGGFGRLVASAPVQIAAGAIGIALLVVTVWAGWFGRQGGQDNWTPTFVYVVF
ncbi:MAG: fenitrothion hydrolase, partial [Solirubrobacteraceae bacterium]